VAAHHRAELESLRAELEGRRGEAGRLGREADAARRECEAMRGQLDDLSQERERLAALRDEPIAPHQEAERRFQDAVARFTRLVEQIESLEAERGRQGRAGAPTGALGRLWAGARHKGKEDDQQALYRRLESLRAEAAAERERAEGASADAVRADFERQLAEARRQSQEAVERADRLAAELRGRRGPEHGYAP
jgi:hypothetical protein